MVKYSKFFLIISFASFSFSSPMALQALASIGDAAAGLGQDKPAPTSEPPVQQPDPSPSVYEPVEPASSSESKPYTPPTNNSGGGYPSPRNKPIGNRSRGRIISPSPRAVIKPIDFVNPEFGILAQNDLVDNNRYYHVYHFQGKKNQPVNIRLVGSKDSRLGLKPTLYVYAPKSKEILAKRFGDDNAGRNAFVYLRLPEDGTYQIVVTSIAPKATGRYSLMLRDDRATYLFDKVANLTAQSPKLKRDNSSFELFEFQGKQDQFVNIRVDSLRAEFSPSVSLLNSKGTVISTSTDVNHLYRTLIERTQLPADDKYYIMVNSATSDRRGRFRVSVY